MSKAQNSSNQEQQQQGRALAEWVSFGIASFILVAIAGLVVHQWLTKAVTSYLSPNRKRHH